MSFLDTKISYIKQCTHCGAIVDHYASGSSKGAFCYDCTMENLRRVMQMKTFARNDAYRLPLNILAFNTFPPQIRPSFRLPFRCQFCGHYYDRLEGLLVR